MLAQMASEPWYRQDSYAAADSDAALGRVSLGFKDLASQPASSPDGLLRAVMTGEIYDRAQRRQALLERGYSFSGEGQAELLLRGYAAEGVRFFRGLRGMFAAAIWDGRSRRLILVSDRFGLKPLYYAKFHDRLLFASQVKALTVDPDLPGEPNLRGAVQFFTFGQLLGQETFFDRIRVLPPASWLSCDLDSGDVRIERYWKPAAATDRQKTSKAEWLDAIESAFVTAVQRRAGGAEGLGISLSGGMDARTILGVLSSLEVSPIAVTLGLEGSIDHRCSERLAGLVGSRYHYCQLAHDFVVQFEDHLRRMVRLTDGHYLSQCVVIPTLDVYRKLGVQALFRGHGGELLHMRKAYNFSVDREALNLQDELALEEWLFQKLQRTYGAGVGASLFRRLSAAEATASARESLRACLRESRGWSHPLERISHMFLTQRIPRETALSMAKFGSRVELRLPYLDEDLVDVILAAPPELRIDYAAQIHVLEKRAPELLRVAESNSGARPETGRLGRALARLRLRVFAKLRVRGYQPYEQLGPWLRGDLQPLVKRLLLDEQCLERGIFDADAVRSMVEQHVEGRQDYTFTLLALMTFEMGQRELTSSSLAAAQAVG